MTNARFDALASKTRSRRGGRYRHTERGTIGFCLVRGVIWLTAIFARRESVTIAEYRRRFGVSLRSFRRDLALIREAGFYLEAAAVGTYRMVCFARDNDWERSVQRRLRFQRVVAEQDDDRPQSRSASGSPRAPVCAPVVVQRASRPKHLPLYRDYRWRFGVSMDTFRRDKRKVRLTVGQHLRGHMPGQYRTCLYIESISHE